MHRFSLWLNVWELWTFSNNVSFELFWSVPFIYHIHTHSRESRIIFVCSVATTYGNKLIAEIRAIALGGSFIGQRSPQHNIKKGDEATFTHVNAYIVAKAMAPAGGCNTMLRYTTQIFGIISPTFQLSSSRQFNPQVLSSLLKLTTWGWAC
jgi:hypothetical protein